MGLLFQVILINLIVSFDNIGVIALASRNLSKKKASLARQLGIWLSLVLKLIFMIFVGYLFSLPWLHIRIIGGSMLVYVIYSMIKEQSRENIVEKQPKNEKGRFIIAIMSIVLADISMSLDNVIAVASLVANDHGYINAQGLSIAFLGFAISVPILLIFSEAAINLINRYVLVSSVCAGYLAFIASSMIFEDDIMLFVFRYFNFTFASQLAVFVGVATCFVSFYLGLQVRRRAI